jgi:hypothetical protein
MPWMPAYIAGKNLLSMISMYIMEKYAATEEFSNGLYGYVLLYAAEGILLSIKQ